MVWISKKKLDERITELEGKINELDPEKISGKIDEEINRFKKATKDREEELKKASTKEIEKLSARLDETNSRVNKQNTKIEEFISSSQKLTKIVIPRVFNEAVSALVLSQNEVYARMQKIKEMLGEVFGEDFEKQLQDIKKEFEEVMKPKEPEAEEVSSDEETTTEEQVSVNEETNSAESEQQTTEEEIPDDT